MTAAVETHGRLTPSGELLVPHQWLIADLIPAGGIVGMWGPPGPFGSVVALDIAAAVAAGAPWASFKTTGGPVVFAAGTGAATVPDRIVATCEHCGYSRDLPFLFMRGVSDPSKVAAAVESEGVEPALIVLDGPVSVDPRFFARSVRAMADACGGCAVIVNHPKLLGGEDVAAFVYSAGDQVTFRRFPMMSGDGLEVQTTIGEVGGATIVASAEPFRLRARPAATGQTHS